VLDLTSLDVRERHLDSARRLGLTSLDLLHQSLLAPPQPVGDLLDHATPLGGVRLELLERLGDRRLRRALELLAQPDDRRPLLVGSRDELGRLGLDPRLGVRDQLLLPLLEPPQIRLQALLRTVEIVSPCAQPLVDAARGDRERLRELHACGSLPFGELAAAFVRDLPLLLDQRRKGVGTHPREPRLQLICSRSGFLRDEHAQARERLVGGITTARPRLEDREQGQRERQQGQRECDTFDHGRIVVRPYDDAMALADELERIAALSGASAVLAAEAHPDDRIYVCSFEEADGGRTWLAYDAEGEPVGDRLRVRDAVSIIALCELAAETAAGGDLDELRSQLAALRVTENPPGIEEAEEASLELQHVIGAPPTLATPARLDEIGSGTRKLEVALGSAVHGSPFAEAMKGAGDVIDALFGEVERSYRIDLR